MDPTRVSELHEIYRSGLVEDVIPFWLRHGMDPENGGCFTALDRSGCVIDTDKSVWFQGRFAWLLSQSIHVFGANDEWLQAAGSCVEFLRQYCFDTDGQMFFSVTTDGRPLRKRRYLFSELFAVIAFAAYARVSGDDRAADDATRLMRSTVERLRTPGLLEPKTNPLTRPSRGFGVPMILLNTAAVVRDCLGDVGDNRAWCNRLIDECIRDIQENFLNSEYRAVLETTGPNGQLIDHFDGRLLNPGHAIEGAWFVLNEARYRGGDASLTELGTQMLDWMWEWGWDREHGGITYFRDVRNLPVQEYWHDMKFWWPQCEAIIATLMAWTITGEERWSQRHAQIHEWTYARFPDPEHGEWYGYLHRDGRIANESKGTMWKGPFHIPRMQLTCRELLADARFGAQ